MDYFGKDASALRGKRLFLFDMDGTIYEEETLFEGTQPLLEHISRTGGRYVFITNNSSRSVTDYVRKLHRLGLAQVGEEHFFTSSQATILYLREHYPHARVYCQGTASLVKELREGQIDVTEKTEKVDVVLVGFDTELTSEKLRRTCEILSTQEVAFLATNPDFRCPVHFGFIPDCGSLCEMLTHATGKKPLFIGKPEARMIQIAREKLGYSREETVVLGDRLYTDIAAGANAGVTTVCVLTGEASVADILASDVQPTFTYASVKELLEELSAFPDPFANKKT